MSKTEHRYSKKVRIWTTVGVSAMALIGVLCIVVSSVGMSLLSRIDFVGTDEPYDPNATLPTEQGDDTQYSDPVDPDVYNHAENISDIPIRGNEKGIRNILLLGVDSKTFNGRSDAMILLSVNDKTKTIRLVSFLRDTWVTIPGRDRNKDGVDDIDKLNAAYAYGKFSLLEKTMEQNFRLKIDEYIAVNFKVLPILIDAMGGLDIELTSKEMARIPAANCDVSHTYPGFRPLTGKPGVHHLNGFQAMEYARIRKIDSDFKRTERQRKVITLLLEKAKGMSTAQLLSMVTDALEHVRTNMSADDLIGLATNAMKYTSYTIENSYHLPQDGAYKGSYINGGSGLQFTDLRQSITDLHQYIYN
ncbi:MAG: LCP family protein [Clostridia bacterium]|nr:LCP family protein [Clostridia bacterium]